MAPAVVAPKVPTIVLQPSGRAAGRARRFVAEWLRRWEFGDDSDALVIVSELVTNSLVHADGLIVVRIERDEHDGCPVIEVWDGDDGRPEIQPADGAAECGRGLCLVSALASAWGTRPLRGGGKVTWAKC